MPPPHSHSTFAVLRHTHFRNVWIAAFISSLGGWMEIVGVQWAMAQATLADAWVSADRPGATIMMAYLAAAQLLPQLFLGVAGGVLADVVDRKKLLLITQAARMIVAAALCVLAFRGVINPWLLIVLGCLDGIAMAFNIPAWQVLTPRLVPREDLTAAITLNGLQFNLARALGPAVGGVLLGFYGPWLLFLLNAISYVFVIVAVMITPDAPPPPREPDKSPWALVREAWHYLLHHRAPLYLILAISIFSMLATPLLRMMPILVKETYIPGAEEHLQEKAYGALLGSMGAGAVAGALLIKRIPIWYPRHHFIPMSITGCGLMLCWYSASTNLLMAGVSVFLTGIFWMWAFNASFSALQLLVEDRIRGRVLAIGNTISFGCMPLGAFIAGAIGDHAANYNIAGRTGPGLGAQVGLGSVSLALVFVGLAMLTWRVPEIDGLKQGDDGYDRRPGLLRGLLATAHRRG